MYADSCSCCGGELHDLADDNEDWDKIYNDIARQLLNGEDLNTDAVYKKTASELMAAMHKGLGGTAFDDTDSRKALQTAFKTNLEQFSYAKTLTQFKLFKDAMFNDKGQIQSFDTVKKAVFETGEVFNKNYLRAEHQFVTQSAIMAHKWETMDAEYLEFTTVGDGRVRPEHKLFDKFTALKSDPIWKRLYTPLSWGCRCTVIPGIAKNLSKEYDSAWANKVVDPLVKGTLFDNNVGITKKIFTDKHPYFKTPGAKENIKQDNPISQEDYKILHKSLPFERNITWLKEADLEKVFPTIDIEKVNAVNMYSKLEYQDINGFNRGKTFKIDTKNGVTRDYYKSITRTINKALDEMPDKFIGTVYRGTDLDEKTFKGYLKAFETKKPYADKGFTSSSYDAKKAFNGAHNFVINSKSGTIIEKISAHGTQQELVGGLNENEVLFKAEQKFKVTNIKEYAKGKWRIDMEEI